MSFQVLNMKMDVLFVMLAQNLSKNRIPKSRKKIVKKTKRQLLDYLTSGNRNYQTANNRTNFFYYSAVILDFLVERFFPVVDEYVGICDINLVVIVFDDFRREKSVQQFSELDTLLLDILQRGIDDEKNVQLKTRFNFSPN